MRILPNKHTHQRATSNEEAFFLSRSSNATLTFNAPRLSLLPADLAFVPVQCIMQQSAAARESGAQVAGTLTLDVCVRVAQLTVLDEAEPTKWHYEAGWVLDPFR